MNYYVSIYTSVCTPFMANGVPGVDSRCLIRKAAETTNVRACAAYMLHTGYYHTPKNLVRMRPAKEKRQRVEPYSLQSLTSRCIKRISRARTIPAEQSVAENNPHPDSAAVASQFCKNETTQNTGGAISVRPRLTRPREGYDPGLTPHASETKLWDGTPKNLAA